MCSCLHSNQICKSRKNIKPYQNYYPPCSFPCINRGWCGRGEGSSHVGHQGIDSGGHGGTVPAGSDLVLMGEFVRNLILT